MDSADPDAISEKAYERGSNQLGTLGSGNHFVEVGHISEIFDSETASKWGLFPKQLVISIHTGSRGLGYQVCDDYISIMLQACRKYRIALPDKQLAAAPVSSDEGKRYFSAMSAAANFAFANRAIIGYYIGESIEKALEISPSEHRLSLLYDVCHNIAKKETHIIDGKKKKVVVHRKGATRALPAGHSALPAEFTSTGHPVIVPGDMGTESYILVGTQKALDETFGSSCHGAGRVMSRNEAKTAARKRNIVDELRQEGIIIQAAGKHTIAEEMPDAYKNITAVVDVMHNSGLCKKVAQWKPRAVLKG
jgi:tRNA-splicing ligase RtcB (3'-phosphate/5'-hydroxy nucleic acid ligase)